jgi:hypothetical protein
VFKSQQKQEIYLPYNIKSSSGSHLAFFKWVMGKISMSVALLGPDVNQLYLVPSLKASGFTTSLAV